jgi:hypothetical protein
MPSQYPLTLVSLSISPQIQQEVLDHMQDAQHLRCITVAIAGPQRSQQVRTTTTQATTPTEGHRVTHTYCGVSCGVSCCRKTAAAILPHAPPPINIALATFRFIRPTMLLCMKLRALGAFEFTPDAPKNTPAYRASPLSRYAIIQTPTTAVAQLKLITSPHLQYRSATYAVPDIHTAATTYGGKLRIWLMAIECHMSSCRMMGKK